MNEFNERCYVIKKNGPVYFTSNMDKTSKWFEDVLGWYNYIPERNGNGVGLYSCLYDLPTEIENNLLFL